MDSSDLEIRSGAALKQRVAARLDHIYFIPLDDFPTALLDTMADEYRLRLGVSITLHEPLPVDRAAMDHKRGQYIGEEVVKSVMRQLPALAEDQSALLIAFTSTDLYIGSKRSWRFAFAIRLIGRFAVISTARMDPEAFGLEADDIVLMSRLRKMVSKTIGGYYYGLPERTEKSSVMFSPILGVDDLDEVSGDYDELDLDRMEESGK
ncbi:MAG: hypothetical protein K2X00_01110 [Nitrospiraceae bacterium]|nr:hypothetical protein [Nitrospiraceae bacterium]